MTNLKLTGLSQKTIQILHHWAVVQATRDAMANTKPRSDGAEDLAARALQRDLNEIEQDAVAWFYHETYSAFHGWVLHPAKP